MDTLKGITEILEHILYELFGLLIPGAAMGVAILLALGPEAWNGAMEVTDSRWWLTLGIAYVLGYVTQGISRPLTGLFRAAFLLPSLALRRLARKLPSSWQAKLRAGAQAVDGFLLRRHTHSHAIVTGDRQVALAGVAREWWEQRLKISDGRVLSSGQVTDLSFSALLGNLGRLDRFRAATSLCRGTAAAVAVAFLIVFMRILWERRAPTLIDFFVLEGLAVAFYALMERADFYDGSWKRVIHPQFLAHLVSGETPTLPQGDCPRGASPRSTGGTDV